VRPRQRGRWALLLVALFLSPCLAQEKIRACGACHGPDGNSTTPGIPSIAGQPKLFMENQLVLFREGIRKSPVMVPQMQGVSDQEIIQMAEHFSRAPARSVASGVTDKKLAAQGRALAGKLRCGECHLRDFGGQKQMPRLAGQREDYLEAEMRAYRANQRPDTTMSGVLYGVKDEEIKALAYFLARTESKPRPR